MQEIFSLSPLDRVLATTNSYSTKQFSNSQYWIMTEDHGICLNFSEFGYEFDPGLKINTYYKSRMHSFLDPCERIF